MGRGAVRSLRLAGLVLTAAALLLVPSVAAAKKHKKHKKVNYNALYTTTNDPTGNRVITFRRNADGTLRQLKKQVKTGGLGIAAQPPFGFPIVDASGSTQLTPNGKLLFVPNDGDNTISAFQITAKGPKLVDRVTSGGILPVSMTIHKNLLYILNEVSGTIFGYRFSKTGFLTPIVNSERALSRPGPDGVAAQIGFTPDGRVLVVTQRGLPAHKGTIDTFVVKHDGSTAPAQAHTADDANPFGFAFAGSHLIVSNVGFVATPPNVMPDPTDPTQFNGSTSSYTVSDSGALTLVNTVASNARAACWVVISKDGNSAFVVNTLSDSVPNTGSGKGSISRYSIGSGGQLSLLSPNADTTPAGFPGDEGLSSDGKFLYVLTPFVMGQNKSHLDAYSVSGANLTHIQSTPSTLPNGVSGVGVH